MFINSLLLIKYSLQCIKLEKKVISLEHFIEINHVSPDKCKGRILKSKIEEKINRLAPNIKNQVITRLANAVITFARQYKVDPDLVLAIAHEESRFNASAISRVGAIGVMQVMPFWANNLEWVEQPNDLYNIEKNIQAGTFILSQYLKMFNGNQKLALLAYNRGPGKVLLDIKNGNDPDNGYPSSVLAQYSKIRKF